MERKEEKIPQWQQGIRTANFVDPRRNCETSPERTNQVKAQQAVVAQIGKDLQAIKAGGKISDVFPETTHAAEIEGNEGTGSQPVSPYKSQYGQDKARIKAINSQQKARKKAAGGLKTNSYQISAEKREASP